MEPQFWHERWQRNEIGFHQPAPHAALARHWRSLGLPSGGRVFVPLAGKSRDMLWLAEHGHAVIGIELSEIAVQDFFRELGQQPRVAPRGALTSYSHGQIELLCGDIFELRPETLGPVDAVFDRAALIALPPAMRPRYAAQICRLTHPRAKILLVTLEYDQAQMAGPPHSVPADEVARLFGATHALEVLQRDEQLADFPKFAQRGLSALAEVSYVLRPK